MNTIHALLVGINDYHKDSGVASLKGCVDDTGRMKNFLQKHFEGSCSLNIARLVNEQSTYENIVKHFGKTHLLKAKADDTILFYYSGHGAREKAAEEFKEYFPGGYNESIVCYDSRIENGKDLADKELAVLISRLSDTGAHVVVIMDCCHSGSGTKDIGDFELGLTRQTYDRKEPRPYESYLDGYFAEKYPGGHGIEIPSGQHILLAACRDKEKAYELKSKKGFFTTYLLKVLEKGAAISYADLYTKARAAMRRLSESQNPQFETSGHFDAFGRFLTGAKSGKSKRYLATLKDKKWTINCGAINGLPTDTDKKAEFAIYKDGKSTGHAFAKIVGVQESEITLDFESDSDTYDAELISLPAPGIPVEVKANRAGKKRLKNALKEQKPLHVEFTYEKGIAPFLLEVNESVVQVLNAKTKARLRTIEGEDHFKVFDDAFRFLDHLANWEKTLDLQNRQVRMDTDDAEIILEEFGPSGETFRHNREKVVLDAEKSGNRFKPVQIGLKVRNNHHRNLHCSMFYLSQDYGVSYLDYREIPAFETATFIKKDTLNILPGAKESNDIFKVFVSTEKIDDFLLEQEEVKLGKRVTFDIQKGFDLSKDDLADSRALGSKMQPEDEDTGSDWFTKTMIVKTVGRENQVSDKPVEMADGMIKVMPHSKFKAQLSMTVANTGSKDIEEVAMVPRLMRMKGMEMVSFGDTTRDVYGSPNVLELTEIEDDGSLAENPLEILINTKLRKNEDLLPLTFDGEHILPVGEATRQKDGSTKVEIRHIPETQAVNRKSLTKALKMVFMKLVLRKSNITKLCWINYHGEKPKRVEKGIKEKVASAQNILMVIHGIIGDTQGQCESMQQAVEDGSFDLILSFDYENLNTPIEQTAQNLKDKLKEAGIKENTGKNFWILAHSMGGLVSRYFIEMLNGKSMVKHLIMAGTPNGGSAIGDITSYRDTAITLMGFLLNGFASLPLLPYLAVLRTVLKGSQKLTFTLAQMKEKDSKFIEALENSAPPGIPYSIVAGHLFEFIDQDEDTKSLVDKMFKMGGKLFYKDRPNDLAVSVESIKHVLHDSIHPDRIRDLPGHHLNYFTLEESVEILYELINSGLKGAEA